MSVTPPNKALKAAAEEYRGHDHNSTGACKQQGFLAGADYERKKALVLLEALKKIADPRLRDHKEPDTYTELGCVMHMADEAISTYEGET